MGHWDQDLQKINCTEEKLNVRNMLTCKLRSFALAICLQIAYCMYLKIERSLMTINIRLGLVGGQLSRTQKNQYQIGNFMRFCLLPN